MTPSIKRIYSMDAEAFEPPNTPKNRTLQRTESHRSLSHLNAWQSAKIEPTIDEDINRANLVRSISSLDSSKKSIIFPLSESKTQKLDTRNESTQSCCVIS